MKFSIKNLFAVALTLVVLTGSAFASINPSTNKVTVLSQVKNINKIVVSGNVELLLIQAPVEGVKVYDSYMLKMLWYNKKMASYALVLSKNKR